MDFSEIRKDCVQQLSLEVRNLLETFVIVMTITIIVIICLNRQKRPGTVYMENRVAGFGFDRQEARQQSVVPMYVFKYPNSPFLGWH